MKKVWFLNIILLLLVAFLGLTRTVQADSCWCLCEPVGNGPATCGGQIDYQPPSDPNVICNDSQHCDSYSSTCVAEQPSECKEEPNPVTDASTSTQSNSQSASNSGSSYSLSDPLGINGNLDNLWVRIIKFMLGLIGGLSLVTFVYAGFLFLISSGNPEQIKKAKQIIVYAVLGILLSMSIYILLSFVIKVLEGNL